LKQGRCGIALTSLRRVLPCVSGSACRKRSRGTAKAAADRLAICDSSRRQARRGADIARGDTIVNAANTRCSASTIDDAAGANCCPGTAVGKAALVNFTSSRAGRAIAQASSIC
jgi:hypothetical protein